MTKILVPVDFSDCAAEVVEEAAKLALDSGAELELLHVIDLGGVDPDAILTADGGEQVTAQALLVDEANASLSELARAAEALGVKTSLALEFGRPEEMILGHANKQNPRMIVMGTHGRKGLSRWILGSVAALVMRGAECPVVIHRTEYKDHCEPKNCAWCGTHVSEQARRVRAELVG